MPEKNKANLDEFSFDTDDDMFFSVEPYEAEEKEKNRKEKINAREIKKKEDEEDDEIKEEVEFFKDENDIKTKVKSKEKVVKETIKKEEKEQEDEDEEAKEIEENDSIEDIDDEEAEIERFTATFEDFKEKGIFTHAKVKKGEKITEDRFFELSEEEFEGRVDSALEDIFEEINNDEKGKVYIKYLKNGGKSEDFINKYLNTPAARLNIQDFDTDNSKHVNQVLIHYLTHVEKIDAEEIEDKIKYWKETGKDKSQAKKYYDLIIESDKATKKAILEKNEQIQKNNRENTRVFNESLKKLIDDSDTLDIFDLSEKDKKRIFSSLTVPTNDGKKISLPSTFIKLSNILDGKTAEDKKKLLILSYLIENDFDFSDIVTKSEDKVTKEIKSGIRKGKLGTVNKKTINTSRKRSVSDYF